MFDEILRLFINEFYSYDQSIKVYLFNSLFKTLYIILKCIELLSI